VKIKMTSESLQQIFGLIDNHIDYASLEVPVHSEIVKPLLMLKEYAQQNHFDLVLVSGFRSFERQLVIWNEKIAGVRPVYDDDGNTLDVKLLSDWECVQAILRWSALPGASRHHWGTDIDVYDRSAVSNDYRVQLSAYEVSGDGPFGKFHDWLDVQIQMGNACGFYRPYSDDLGGIAPERWHLSYAPIANRLANRFSQAFLESELAELVQSMPISLRETVLSHLDEIFERFIKVPVGAQ